MFRFRHNLPSFYWADKSPFRAVLDELASVIIAGFFCSVSKPLAHDVIHHIFFFCLSFWSPSPYVFISSAFGFIFYFVIYFIRICVLFSGTIWAEKYEDPVIGGHRFDIVTFLFWENDPVRQQFMNLWTRPCFLFLHKYTCIDNFMILLLPHDHLLLDRSPNIGQLLSRWELDKFKNCWNKSSRTSKFLTLLYQQSSNLLISQRDMSGPRLGALSNNSWSGGIYTEYDIVQGLRLLFILWEEKDHDLTKFEKEILRASVSI